MRERSHIEKEPPLVCVECGARSFPAAEGWHAYLTDDDELAIFCPFCAWRVFGPHRGYDAAAELDA
jgi:DNA-directed RNA polymerase subunit RPC12/RpoP